jgi:hypothetical protein
MTSDHSVPRNDLERLLEEMQTGLLEAEDFARRLLEMQVFVPVKDEKRRIGGFQQSLNAEPLVVEDEEGHRVLVMFSAPDRAKAFIAAYPGYGGGILTEFSWMLRRVGGGVSISLNPGLEPGFDLDAEMVAMMMALLPEQA